MISRPGDARGFTLVEMLIAMAIMVTVTGGIFAVFNPSEGTYRAQPEVSDMQQRLRIGIDSVRRDLVMAGAGTYSGSAVGTLVNFFAPIVPMRVGTDGADPPGTVRTEAVTIMYVPTTPAQTTIRDPMPNASAELKVNEQPGCPASDDLCGFKQGMRLLIFDDTGSYDVFTVTQVQSSALHLQHRDDNLSKPYDEGAYITQVASHTYYYDATNRQLRHYDGYQTDLPLIDNVVGVRFEYYGEPQPPVLRKPVTDPKGPWTTYAPKPPPIGVNNAADSWGAGENCAFLVDGPIQTSRMATLGAPGSGLVPLTSAMLSDGPWCPHATAPNRYDADLLRVRMVRTLLRVQTGVSALRGPVASTAADALFRVAGTSTNPYRTVPDQEVKFDVTPRNLNLGR
jgi:prepilin-type N-terminal cleavage/methylation domain-containing protein